MTEKHVKADNIDVVGVIRGLFRTIMGSEEDVNENIFVLSKLFQAFLNIFSLQIFLSTAVYNHEDKASTLVLVFPTKI